MNENNEGRSLSLYELESELTDAMEQWLESAQDDAPLLEEVVRTYLSAAVEKRDKVARFMLHLVSQSEFAAGEIQRLQQRKRVIDNSHARLKQYVAAVMESQGVKKLEGKTHTLRLRKTPTRIEIVDEALVPERHKVPQPAKVSKTSLMTEYKMWDERLGEGHGREVPGAQRVQDGKTVVIS